jgi:putative transcriptional regulator
MAKREIFRELQEGVSAMRRHRQGKLTLRSYKVEPAPLPEVDSSLIRDTRKKLRCSRAVFARDCESTKGLWKSGTLSIGALFPELFNDSANALNDIEKC